MRNEQINAVNINTTLPLTGGGITRRAAVAENADPSVPVITRKSSYADCSIKDWT